MSRLIDWTNGSYSTLIAIIRPKYLDCFYMLFLALLSIMSSIDMLNMYETVKVKQFRAKRKRYLRQMEKDTYRLTTLVSHVQYRYQIGIFSAIKLTFLEQSRVTFSA